MIRAMRTAAWTTAVAASLLLAACGGGGGVTDLATSGGTSGTGISQGPVNNFGSVIVNGTRYRTDADDPAIATDFEGPVTAGDAFDQESDLAVGMLVQVDWELPPGATDREATRIVYLPEIVGPVTGGFKAGTDPADPATLRVNGLTVVVDSATIVDDPFFRNGVGAGATQVSAPAQFGVGSDIVQISGVLESTPTGTRIRASRIARVAEVASAGDPTEVITGVVNNAQSGSFEIVDTTGAVIEVRVVAGDVIDASLLQDPADGTLLRNGAAVRVEGQLNATATTLDAQEIRRPLDGLQAVGAEPGDQVEAEIKGVITQGAGGTSEFVVNAQRVRFDGSTVFVAPASSANLTAGTRVEVRGTLVVQSDGSTLLEADRISVEQDAEVELEDRVAVQVTDPPDAEGNRTFQTRIGLAVVIRPTTVLKDDRDGSGERLDLPSELPAGAFVEVRGFFDGENLVATVVEREDDDEQGCKLEARVASFEPMTSVYTISGLGQGGLGVVDGSAGGVTLAAGEFGEFETEVNSQCEARPAGFEAGFTANQVEADDDGGVLPDNGGDDDGAADGVDDDLPRIVDTVDDDAVTFTLNDSAGTVVQVTASTLIDDSLINDTVAGPVNSDLPFGSLSLSLSDLLEAGDVITVSGTLSDDGTTIIATSIEADD